MNGSSENPKVLVVAHGHPDVSTGGGELAAYATFEEFGRRGVDAYFLGRAEATTGHGGTPFSVHSGSREVLWHSEMPDYFRFSQPNKHIVWSAFRDFLQNVQPDVVHFHHYLYVGLELLREVKRFNERTRLVVTLHDYWGMCHNNGQMVKTGRRALCYRSSPEACHQCFPQYAPTDFFLRELFVKSFFDLVDLFIAPSEFLRQRYIEWGLPPERIVVLENGQDPAEPLPPRELQSGEPRSTFAFFGQVNPFKGIHVLLEAIDKLPSRLQRRIRLDVHGANLELQEADFQAQVQTLLAASKASVRFMGSYRREELRQLMARTDWVVVPSIWWENSPLVIQEAFKFRRPVICSDVGGMAEKVTDGTDGLHFRVGNPTALAECIERAVEEPELWDELHAGIKAPPSIEESADALLSLYASIAESPEPREEVGTAT